MTRVAGFVLLVALTGCSAAEAPRSPALGGDPARGRIIVGRQACGSCHRIPEMMWADGRAGPPLDHIARRTVIGGVLPNTPDNMVRWLRSSQEIVPGNAMPDMRLTDAQARDVAAYLETLR